MNVARRYPRFRRLLASLAVSQAGDWLYNLALLAFVYERTHSSAWLGVTTAARVLPIVVFGPLGGVVADRYDRRRLMLASDAVRFVLMLALALVAAAGLPVVLAPVIAALATAASSVYIPSVAATTPRLVDDADLPAANAARSAIQQVCIVAGPGLRRGSAPARPAEPGLRHQRADLRAVRAGHRLAPRRRRSSPRAASPSAAPNVVRELRDGARALLEQPVALRLIGADIVCSAIYGAETVLLLLLSRELGLGDHGYGYLLASFGLGGVLGAGVAGRVAARERTGVVVVGAMAAGRCVHGAAGRPVRRRRRARPRRGVGRRVHRRRGHGRDRPAAHAVTRRLRPRLRLRVPGRDRRHRRRLADRRAARRALRRARRVRRARRPDRALHADPRAPPGARHARRRPPRPRLSGAASVSSRRPRRRARPAASTRPRTSSLARIREMWTLTVFSLM